MNKSFVKHVASVTIVAFIFMSTTSNAQTQTDNNLCNPEGIVFGFFNGVNTTDTLARRALEELEKIYGNILLSTGEPIRYELFFNRSQGLTVDLIEVAGQRLEEEDELLADRFELFWSNLSGSSDWWDRITKTVEGAGNVLSGMVDYIEAEKMKGLADLVQAFTESPYAEVTYTEHRLKIDTAVLEGKKLVFLAHSQGNFFVNKAYDYAKSLTKGETVKVVHVAPASPTLRGDHVLADLDLVINGLRVAGTVPSVTHTIPTIGERPPGLNGNTDPLGHGLLEIYLNPSISTRNTIDLLVNNALTNVIAPNKRAEDGFFTVILTWDGAGDVDLHVFEPAGRHVYFADRRGASGYLDVDNRVIYGPEHYFASCNAETLQDGTYEIRLANYFRADGRTATVQLSTAQDGVRRTKSVSLGEPTYVDPVHPVFNVIVSKDAETGKYKVNVQ